MSKPFFWIAKPLLTVLLILLSSPVSLFSNAFPKHDFYLSICEIIYKEDKGMLEISFRFFSDDFEKAIANYNNTATFTKSGIKAKKSDEHIYKYLKEHFLIFDSKNQIIDYKFIGWEIEKELCWCYVEAKSKGFNQLKLKNNLLTEMFARQKNLVYLKSGNKETSIILDKDNKTGVLTLE